MKSIIVLFDLLQGKTGWNILKQALNKKTFLNSLRQRNTLVDTLTFHIMEPSTASDSPDFGRDALHRPPKSFDYSLYLNLRFLLFDKHRFFIITLGHIYPKCQTTTLKQVRLFDMNMRLCKIWLYTITGFVLLACDKDENNAEESNIENFIFEDGFETQNNTLGELFPSHGNRWTGIQQANPSNVTNEISISETTFSEGQNSLRLFAYRSDSILSKMNIEKGGFSAFKGDKVIIKADFFIRNTANIENLLLIDLECCSCWDIPRI